MADLESSFRTLTLQHPAVATAFSTRFFWDKIPDSVTYPCIKAQTIADNPSRAHTGATGGRALVQLDVYDNDKSNANTGAALLRNWLDNYRGGMGTYNVTIQVRNAPGSFDAESRLFRRMLEVEVLYF